MTTKATLKLVPRLLPHLVTCARRGEVITYKNLGAKIGVHYRAVTPCLYYIRDEICHPRGLPLLTAIVVRQDTGLPGGSWLPEGTEHLSDEEYRREYEKYRAQVFACDKWDSLLEDLVLSPSRSEQAGQMSKILVGQGHPWPNIMGALDTRVQQEERMDEVAVSSISRLRRDLALRGYTESEIDELLQMPILLIPGQVTPENSDTPGQRLTKHIAFLSKDLQRESIPNTVILQKGGERTYLDERQAHVDLGTIVVSIFAAQQIARFADVAQILDFLLNLIRYRLAAGRTDKLMPEVSFDLELQNGEKVARLRVEGKADGVNKTLTPSRLKAMLSTVQGDPDRE